MTFLSTLMVIIIWFVYGGVLFRLKQSPAVFDRKHYYKREILQKMMVIDQPQHRFA